MPILCRVVPVKRPCIRRMSPPANVLSRADSSGTSVFVRKGCMQVRSQVLVREVVVASLSKRGVGSVGMGRGSVRVPVRRGRILVMGTCLGGGGAMATGMTQ